LNQQAQLVSPLRRTGDFLAVPEQIKFFMADETLAGQRFFATRREFRFDVQRRKRESQPVVNAPVTFLGPEQIPFVAGRENCRVRPVGVMRHESAAGGPAEERKQLGRGGNFGVFLKIAKRRCGFGPAIKSQYRRAEPRGMFQQRLVQRHVAGRVTLAGVE